MKPTGNILCVPLSFIDSVYILGFLLIASYPLIVML